MKTRDAMRRGWKLWKAMPTDMLTYAVLALILLLLPAAPLLCLTDASTAPFAALGIVLFVFITLPGRRNAAAVLDDAAAGKSLRLVRLAEGRDYLKKTGSALVTALCLLAWGAPGIAATVWAYQQYAGASDVVTIAMQINRLGGGDLINGLVYTLLLYLATWLPFIFGLCFHSGTRYAAAHGGRKLLKGKRRGVMCTWLCSLVTALPFVIAAVITVAGVTPAIKTAMNTFDFTPLKASFRHAGIWLLVEAAVLLLPLIPLRHCMLAAHVAGLTAAPSTENKAEETAEAAKEQA